MSARILVIDDEANIRTMIRLALEHVGHSVETAADGKEGLEKYGSVLAGHDIDLTVIPDLTEQDLEKLGCHSAIAASSCVQSALRMKPARLLLCGDCGRKSLPPHAPSIARACRTSVRVAAKPQVVAGLAGAFLAFAIHGASGMEIEPNGNQLTLSGPVANGDLQKVADALSNSSSVNTIVLRNSPGGNIATGYRLGE